MNGDSLLLGGTIVITLGILLFSLLFTAFWIWMLVDCIRRDFKDKVLWILILVFANLIGAPIYYFAVYRASK